MLPIASDVPVIDPNRVAAVTGMCELLAVLKVGSFVEAAMLKELEGLGATCTSELTLDDWTELAIWSSLRPLQQRRLLRHLSLE